MSNCWGFFFLFVLRESYVNVKLLLVIRLHSTAEQRAYSLTMASTAKIAADQLMHKPML